MPTTLGYIREDSLDSETPPGLLMDLLDARAKELGLDLERKDIWMEPEDAVDQPTLTQLLKELPHQGANTMIVPNYRTLASTPQGLLHDLSVLDHLGVRTEAVSCCEEAKHLPDHPVELLEYLLELGEI